MTVRKSLPIIMLLALLLALGSALAQDDQPAEEGGGEAETGEAEAGPAADAPPAEGIAPDSFPQLLNLNLEWVNSDICRLIEELRRTDQPQEKRELVEQIEYLVYKHVEYPLVFKQAELSDSLDFERIGTTSDVVDAGSANPLAPLVAEAFALYGIAKGYEGYAAAANDQIARAKKIYPQVESLTIKIDNFEDRKTIKTWLSDTMGNWASTNAVRVTIHGKNVLQKAVDDLNGGNVAVAAPEGGVPEYYLLVAERDFLRGMQRYIVTDDQLTGRRPNEFFLYLPPGTYKLKMDTTERIPVELTVDADPDNNHYIIESLEEGLTCYPRPKVKQTKKKEKKKKKKQEEESSVLDDEF